MILGFIGVGAIVKLTGLSTGQHPCKRSGCRHATPRSRPIYRARFANVAVAASNQLVLARDRHTTLPVKPKMRSSFHGKAAN
jgi:hypothetical protein